MAAATAAAITTALATVALALPHPGSGEARAEPPAASAGLATARTKAAKLNATVDALQLSAEQSTEAFNAVTEELAQLKAARLVSDRDAEELRAAADRLRAANSERVRLLYQSQGEYGVLGTLFAGGAPDDMLDRAQVATAVIRGNRTAAADAAAGAREGTDIANAAQTRQGRQVVLAGQAAQHAAGVQRALTAAATAFSQADAEVARMAEADRLAAEATAARAFAARLAAAQLAAAERAAAERAAAAGLGQTLPGTGTADGLVADAVVGLPPPSPAAAGAIAAARTRLGTPYLWGAVGPTSFDCSGLTGWAYRQAGVSLPRTSREQWYAGNHPSLAELASGDLLFWATNTANPATIHHVALYVGNGMMIAAPRSGDVVKVQPVYGNGFIGAVRPTVG